MNSTTILYNYLYIVDSGKLPSLYWNMCISDSAVSRMLSEWVIIDMILIPIPEFVWWLPAAGLTRHAWDYARLLSACDCMVSTVHMNAHRARAGSNPSAVHDRHFSCLYWFLTSSVMQQSRLDHFSDFQMDLYWILTDFRYHILFYIVILLDTIPESFL